MTIPEVAVQNGIAIANDQSHGYSQANRWGKPDYDCSSFVISVYKMAGVPINIAKVYHTGTMTGLKQYGFKDVTKTVNLNTGSGLQPGDILWWHSGNATSTNGHTAMYIGGGKIVHARGQKYGSSAPGDQGTEITTQAYYRGSWQHVYRYVGGGTATITPTPAPVPTVKRYAVTTQMPIIKYGSVSRAVKVWQTIIGVEADGEFGKNTLAATLQFQRASDLEDDGEVGPLTWSRGLSII